MAGLALGWAGFCCSTTIGLGQVAIPPATPTYGTADPQAATGAQPGSAPGERMGTTASTGPIVHAPVAPGIQDQDLRNLPRAEIWKPGDPVRVRPDLKRSDDKAR